MFNVCHSQINIKEVKHNFDGRIHQIQDDIRVRQGTKISPGHIVQDDYLFTQELTAAILDQICAKSVLVPLRTDRVVIFSEFLPWDKVNRLEFSYSNCMLTPYPKMVFMLVRVLPPPETCPDAPKSESSYILVLSCWTLLAPPRLCDPGEAQTRHFGAV